MLEEYASSAMMFQTGCDSKRINPVWLRLTRRELFGELCAALHAPAPCVCAPFGKLFNKPDVPLELTQSKPCHLLISRNCVFDTSLGARNFSRVSPFARLTQDSVWQAKAAKGNGASCPTITMAPVLAITGLVARSC